MDWLIAGITILSMELIGRKHWAGWAVGMVNQPIWLWFVVYDKQMYGLAIIPVVLFWRYSVALVKWRRDAAL